MNALTNRPPVGQCHHYFMRSSAHTSEFNPFDPDLIGALREAYAFIANPMATTVSIIDGKKQRRSVYDANNYNMLVDMIDRAIRKAEPVQCKP